MYITDDIKYIGVNDHAIEKFELQYIVPNGMAYNSYVIMDEKIAVFDTTDQGFGDEWMANLEEALEGRTPDYLIVQHLEPDHSAAIVNFMNKYPEATVVASAAGFQMMENFYGHSYADRRLVVSDGSELCLGKHTLTFFTAPMVHWPEVIMSYDSCDKVLFAADAFGKFGANDIDEEWDCEARRYYINIVGKYGPQVQAILKKLAGNEIKAICSLHGPVIKEDSLGHCLELYDIWSSYGVESEGVAIVYTSVYGNTEKAVFKLAEELRAKGCPKVAISNLAKDDMAEAVEDAFRYGKLVLATTTYQNVIFPFMKEFIHHLLERDYKNRTIGIIENGSWAPKVEATIKNMFKDSKNIKFTDTTVKIKSGLKEKNYEEISKMADELMAD